MTYNETKWIAAYQKAVKDLGTNKPTGGLPCAIASLRYIRDELLNDHTKAGKLIPITGETVRVAFSDLLKEITTAKGVDSGFLSNASAAAKAAGFATSEEKLASLTD